MHHHHTLGIGAGALVSVVLQPVEFTKIRLQVDYQRYGGILPAIRSIAVDEGPLAFFRGLNASLLGLLPSWAIFFPTYSHLKHRLLVRHVAKRAQRDSDSDVHEKGTRLGVDILSAVAAGALSTTITNPLWVVKNRLQTHVIAQHALAQRTSAASSGRILRQRYHGICSTLWQVVREEGVGSLYAGLIPSYLGLLNVAIQFPLYEQMKTHYRQQRGGSRPTSTQILWSAWVSKLCATVIAYPHEVIRAKLQHGTRLDGIRYSGVRHACRHVWRTEGVPGFYRGLVLTVARVLPSSMVTLYGYELILQYIRSHPWALQFVSSSSSRSSSEVELEDRPTLDSE